jgi:hypothetical protein
MVGRPHLKRIDVEVNVEVGVEIGNKVHIKAYVVITRICAYLQDYLIYYNYVITRTRQFNIIYPPICHTY